MKKTHKQKKELKKKSVLKASRSPTKAMVQVANNLPSSRSLQTAIIERLNGDADETTRELRSLTRSKNETVLAVVAKVAFDNVVETALGGGKHNEFNGGRDGQEAGKSPVGNKTKTEIVSEQKESEPMSVAHTEGVGAGSNGTTDTNGRGVNGNHDLAASIRETQNKNLVGRRPGQRVVHWNSMERDLVARETVKEMMARGVGQIPSQDDRAGARLILDCARCAQQKHLPPGRIRKLTSITDIIPNGILAMLPSAMKTAQAEREAAEQAAARAKLLGMGKKLEEPVAPPPVNTAPPIPAPAAKVEVSPLSQEELADPILAAANALMLALRVQFREMKEIREMHSLMVEEVDGLRKRVEASEAHMREIDKVDRSVVAKVKAELPVVAILGCRKDQFDEVCTKAKERGLNLVFRHYEQDSNPRPISAQWAITFRWVRHSWDDQIKASISPRQSAFIHGGISQGVAQLELWFGGADQQP